MICFIGFILLGIMGIFSSKYRTYAKEAFNSFFRKITLQPCNTSFHEKVKSKTTGKLMKFSPKLAKVFHKNFDTISLIFTLIFIFSILISANAVYNLAMYGTCEPGSDDCPFQIDQTTQGCGLEACANPNCECLPEQCSEPCDGCEIK